MATAAPKLAPENRAKIQRRRSRLVVWMRLCGQLLTPGVVFGSLWLAAALRGVQFDSRYQTLGVIAALLSSLIFSGIGLNQAHWRTGSLIELGSLLLAWASTAASLLVLGDLTKTTALFSRVAVTTWFVLAFLILCLMHVVLWSYFGWLRQKGIDVKTAVIGPMTPVAQRVAVALQADASLGVRLLGYFDKERSSCPGALAYLGTVQGLARFVQSEGVDAAYLALDNVSVEELAGTMASLQGGRTSVFLIPNVLEFELLQSQLQSVGGIPVLAVGDAEKGIIGGVFKRIIDLALSGTALLVLAPILVLIAAAIKLDSSGPVIFRQHRCGLHNEKIVVWKFRSMYWDTGTQGAKMRIAASGDPRITRVGAWLRRTSLDELPQLWNVFCGAMSLVGPRPHALAFNEHYRQHYRGYMLRHKVRPGMTGWAQINGCRGDTGKQGDIQRRLDYDLEYIRRWSPMLDIWILLRTIPALLTNRDVY